MRLKIKGGGGRRLQKKEPPLEKNSLEKAKNQSLIFYDLITEVYKLKNKNNKSKLLQLFRNFSNKLTFIPMKFSYNEEKDKIYKRPLMCWKNPSIEKKEKYLGKIMEKYRQKIFDLGVSLRIDDLKIVIIDIDNVEIFEKALSKNREKFLKDLEKDAFLIVKSLKRGFHIYINSVLGKRLVQGLNLGIKNPDLLNSFGFEIKKQGLSVFPPSTFRYSNLLFESKIIYINPDNFKKDEAESQTLKKIYEIFDKLIVEKSKEETENFEKKLKKRIKNHKIFERIIKEVKEKISFEDFIRDRLAKKYENYSTYSCIFHPPDHHPSFVVYKNQGFEYAVDFHNGEKYDIISFYQKLKNCNFLDALKDLSKLAGINFPQRLDNEKIEKTEPFETEKAFYTGIFSQLKGGTRKRYALLKKEKELWEIEEVEKICDEDEVEIRKAYEVQKKKLNEYFIYKIIYLKNKIGDFFIKDGNIYTDPFTNTSYYDLRLEAIKGRKITIKEATFEKILNELRMHSLIASKQKIQDALSQVLNSLFKVGKIKNGGFPKKGIFLDEEKKDLKFSKLEIKNYNKEELKYALLFLDYLIENFYFHIAEKFVTVLKWFITSPFSFCIKQKGRYLPGLYLFGFSGVGKTSIVQICSYIWKDFKEIRGEGRSGASIDTLARLEAVISNDTFPEIITEPRGAFLKEEILEAIKNSLTNLTLRGKHSYGSYREILALSNLAFTSNYHFPKKDSALTRRFFTITFSVFEMPDKEKREEFLKTKEIANSVLPYVGRAILFHLNELKDLVLSLSEENQFEIAEQILSFLYRKVDLKVPNWIHLKYESEFTLENTEEEIKLFLFSKLKEIFLKEIKDKTLFLSEEERKRTTKEILRKILEKDLIPFAFLRNEKIYLTTKILSRIEDDENIPSLKELAEILGYPYKRSQSIRLGKEQVLNISVISIPFNDFLEILFPSEEEDLKIWEPEKLGLKMDKDLLKELSKDFEKFYDS